MVRSDVLSRCVFLLAAALCLTPFLSSGLALLAGVAIALTLGNPFGAQTKKMTHRCLTTAVIGLGAGMNLQTVAKAGVHGIGYTVIGIGSAFAIGYVLRKALKIERDASILITTGTAICGGSAIAAVAPVLRAKHHDVSVALGIVFMLNACALLFFPSVGHMLKLSETQFGLWSALAIHDTSSVVGATMQYGPHALEIGTTVKLARALWIVPVAFIIGVLVGPKKDQDGPKEKPRRPWFILGFLMMAALVTFVPAVKPVGSVVEVLAKRLLILTLFLIGTNLNREALRAVGYRPFLKGILLWAFMATGTLFAVVEGWIS